MARKRITRTLFRAWERHAWQYVSRAVAIVLLGWLAYRVYKALRAARRASRVSVVARRIIDIKRPNLQQLSPADLVALATVFQYGRIGVPPNPRRALRLYGLAGDKGDVDAKRAAGMLEFHEFGNPDAALALLADGVTCGSKAALIDMAHIYAVGIYPSWQADRVAARTVLMLAVECGDGNIERAAHMELAELMNMGEDDESPDGRILPLQYVSVVTQFIKPNRALPVQFAPTPTALPQNPTVFRPAVVHHVDRPPGGVNGIDVLPPDVRQALQDMPPQVAMRDGQNVHDSLALNAAQAAIGRLGAGAPDASGEVRTYIELSGLGDDVKRDAVRVLELLDDATHSRLGVSQKDALGAVWARIHDPVNADNREGMKQTLVQMLASGVEHDVPVCSTGRLMRIVGALDGADAEDIVRIRPAWAVQEELGTLSAKVREDVLAGASEPERRAYETDTGNAAHGEMLFERMRDALVAKTHEDYVESGLMTEAALALRLEPYIAALEP